MTDREFHLFSRLPCELCLLIWEQYLSDYEDSCGVLWDLKWGVDDSPASRTAIRQRFGEESEGHITIRPFIDLGCQHENPVMTSKLFEVNCNPLLKVNIEARKAATANDRYVSVPVWSRDINIIVRPALDLFRIEGALVELFLWPDVAGDIPQPPRSLDDIVVKSLVLVHAPTFAHRVLISPRRLFADTLEFLRNTWDLQLGWTTAAISGTYQVPSFAIASRMITRSYLHSAKTIVLADGGTDGVIHDAYHREHDVWTIPSGSAVSSSSLFSLTTSYHDHRYQQRCLRETARQMRGELESLWQEQDAVAEREAVPDSQEMRDALRAEAELVLAGLETTGKLVTTASTSSRGTTEVTSTTTQVGETYQGPSLGFLTRADDIQVESRLRSVGDIKAWEAECIQWRTRRVQPLRTMESVEKVRVLAHNHMETEPAGAENGTLVIKLTKEETVMKGCHCGSLSCWL